MQKVTLEKNITNFRARIAEDYSFRLAMIALGTAIYFLLLFWIRDSFLNLVLYFYSMTIFMINIKKNLWRMEIYKDEKRNKALKILKIAEKVEVGVLIILGIIYQF